MEITLVLCVLGSFLLIGMVLLASAIRVVQKDTRLSVYRLGRHIGDKGPGIVVLVPFIDRGILKKLDAVEKTSADD